MLLHFHTQMGRVDLYLPDGNVFAFQFHRLVDGVNLCLGGKGGVKLQKKSEIGQIIRLPVLRMEKLCFLINGFGRCAVIPITAEHVQLE